MRGTAYGSQPSRYGRSSLLWWHTLRSTRRPRRLPQRISEVFIGATGSTWLYRAKNQRVLGEILRIRPAAVRIS